MTTRKVRQALLASSLVFGALVLPAQLSGAAVPAPAGLVCDAYRNVNGTAAARCTGTTKAKYRIMAKCGADSTWYYGLWVTTGDTSVTKKQCHAWPILQVQFP